MKSLKSILSERIAAEDTLTRERIAQRTRERIAQRTDESVFDINKSNPADFLAPGKELGDEMFIESVDNETVWVGSSENIQITDYEILVRLAKFSERKIGFKIPARFTLKKSADFEGVKIVSESVVDFYRPKTEIEVKNLSVEVKKTSDNAWGSGMSIGENIVFKNCRFSAHSIEIFCKNTFKNCFLNTPRIIIHFISDFGDADALDLYKNNDQSFYKDRGLYGKTLRKKTIIHYSDEDFIARDREWNGREWKVS